VSHDGLSKKDSRRCEADFRADSTKLGERYLSMVAGGQVEMGGSGLHDTDIVSDLSELRLEADKVFIPKGR